MKWDRWVEWWGGGWGECEISEGEQEKGRCCEESWGR